MRVSKHNRRCFKMLGTLSPFKDKSAMNENLTCVFAADSRDGSVRKPALKLL